MTRVRERRSCSVSNQGCKAPAGYLVGSGGFGASGFAEGEGSCRGTCAQCGEDVCSACSKRTRRGRICYHCQEDSAWRTS